MTPRAVTLSEWQFWILVAIASCSLLVALLNLVLSGRNQDLQGEIVERQQFVNQTIPISRLNGQLVQGLANLSAKTGDQEIETLLAGQGISFTAPVSLPANEEVKTAGE